MDTKKLFEEYSKYRVADIDLDFPTKTLTLTEYLKPISDEAFTNISEKINLIGRSHGEQVMDAYRRYMLNSLYGLSPRVLNAYGSMLWRPRKSWAWLSLLIKQNYTRELYKRQPFSKVCNLESVIHSFDMEPDFSKPEGTIHIYGLDFKIHKTFYPDINIYDCKCNLYGWSDPYYSRYCGLQLHTTYERLYNPETNNKRCLESVIKKGRIKGGSSKRGKTC